MKAPEVPEEERRRRLSLAVRVAKKHMATRRDQVTREIEIVALASIGLTDMEIAGRLNIQASTVSAYWKRVLARYGARTRTEAVAAVLMLEIRWLRQEIVKLREERGGQGTSPNTLSEECADGGLVD